MSSYAATGATCRLTDELLPGTILRRRYVIVRRIADTEFSSVFLAHDRNTDQQVVIKRLSTAAWLGGLTPAEALHLFVREGLLLRDLRHPQLPGLQAFYNEHADRYMVMDYIPGQTLDQLLEAAPINPGEALEMSDKLCDVVAFLHCQSPPIIHADIKPANIIRKPEGQVVLIDLGIARARDLLVFRCSPVGTPRYAPPEQLCGSHLDERSDIYALGKVVAELLGHSAAEPAIRCVLERATAPEPADRFATVEQFRQALHTATLPLRQPRTSKLSRVLSPRRVWMLTAACVLICVVYLSLLFTNKPLQQVRQHTLILSSAAHAPALHAMADAPANVLFDASHSASLLPTPTIVPPPVLVERYGAPLMPTDAAFTVANTGELGLFLRVDHTLTSTVLETLPDGMWVEQTGVAFVGPDRVWWRVRTPGGNEGWVAAEYLQPAPR